MSFYCRSTVPHKSWLGNGFFCTSSASPRIEASLKGCLRGYPLHFDQRAHSGSPDECIPPMNHRTIQVDFTQRAFRSSPAGSCRKSETLNVIRKTNVLITGLRRSGCTPTIHRVNHCDFADATISSSQPARAKISQIPSNASLIGL